MRILQRARQLLSSVLVHADDVPKRHHRLRGVKGFDKDKDDREDRKNAQWRPNARVAEGQVVVVLIGQP